MFEKKVIDEIEDIFVTELGEGSIFILEQNLRELGLSRETFNKGLRESNRQPCKIY